MARYTYRASSGPDAASVALDLQVTPPHDLPALLVLRRTASDLLRNDPRFATATRVDVYLDGDGEPVATVDRGHLSAVVPVGGAA